jgi:hypothetical protein
MATRIIRDGILTSERVNALSERAELFYRRLMSVVDDYGRFPANLTLLRAACYPLKLDSVKEDSIKKHLAEAEDAGLIVLYTVAAKAYLELQDFGQRIQSKSKYPGPDEAVPEKRGPTVAHGDPPWKTAPYVVEDEVVVEDEGGKSLVPAPAKPATAGPCLILNDGSEWGMPADQLNELADLYPAVDVIGELRAMRAWCLANPTKRKTKGGAMRFVNSWLSKAQNDGRSRGNTVNPRGPPLGKQATAFVGLEQRKRSYENP